MLYSSPVERMIMPSSILTDRLSWFIDNWFIYKSVSSGCTVRITPINYTIFLRWTIMCISIVLFKVEFPTESWYWLFGILLYRLVVNKYWSTKQALWSLDQRDSLIWKKLGRPCICMLASADSSNWKSLNSSYTLIREGTYIKYHWYSCPAWDLIVAPHLTCIVITLNTA